MPTHPIEACQPPSHGASVPTPTTSTTIEMNRTSKFPEARQILVVLTINAAHRITHTARQNLGIKAVKVATKTINPTATLSPYGGRASRLKIAGESTASSAV